MSWDPFLPTDDEHSLAPGMLMFLMTSVSILDMPLKNDFTNSMGV